MLEYWVLDVAGQRMLVHRVPTDAGYDERFELATDQRLTAVGVALPTLELDALLRAVDGG